MLIILVYDSVGIVGVYDDCKTSIFDKHPPDKAAYVVGSYPYEGQVTLYS
jgi:hypothetical protein